MEIVHKRESEKSLGSTKQNLEDLRILPDSSCRSFSKGFSFTGFAKFIATLLMSSECVSSF